MLFRLHFATAVALVFPCAAAQAQQPQWDDNLLKPYVIDHRAATTSPADVSFLTAQFTASVANPIVSDTGELKWYTSDAKTGLVTIETDRTQPLIGFIKANGKTLKNLGADISNNFATILTASLDGKPLARANRILLSACSRVANTDQKWNDAHTGLGRSGQGHSPTLIEPVMGTVTLRAIEGAKSVSAAALDGSGKLIGQPLAGKRTAAGWEIPLGSPVTTWYVVSVNRK